MSFIDESKTKVAVIGAGYMGAGMAAAFALGGHRVILADATVDLARAGRQRLLDEAADFVDLGIYPEDAQTMISELVAVGTSVANAASQAAYIAEVVSEKPHVKAAVFSQISDAADPAAIITSNTSAISIRELETGVSGAHRFLGVHWMNPAQFVPGVELIRGNSTSDATVAAVEELMRSISKISIVVPDTPGFIANRLQYVLHREASRLVSMGLISADDLDTLVSNSFGFRLAFFGPMAIADMAGLDVYQDTYKTLHAEFGESFSPPTYLEELVAKGRTGIKSGGGLTRIGNASPRELAAFRNKSYSLLAELKKRMGAIPKGNHD
jgi:3-hydroxybutyryl-CoA dehydrogenase